MNRLLAKEESSRVAVVLSRVYLESCGHSKFPRLVSLGPLGIASVVLVDAEAEITFRFRPLEPHMIYTSINPTIALSLDVLTVRCVFDMHACLRAVLLAWLRAILLGFDAHA